MVNLPRYIRNTDVLWVLLDPLVTWKVVNIPFMKGENNGWTNGWAVILTKNIVFPTNEILQFCRESLCIILYNV